MLLESLTNPEKITILAIHRMNFEAVLLSDTGQPKNLKRTRVNELNRSGNCTVKMVFFRWCLAAN